MSAVQQGFIIGTFAGPVLLWLLCRRVQSPQLARGISLALAGAIFIALALMLHWHWVNDLFAARYILPMQLCDWAAAATIVALVARRQVAFELAYCWGLAGTAQALFTPAVALDEPLREWCFFIVHGGIPAGVLWLILYERMRPQPGALLRVMLWSEVYLVLALLANWATGANFGFLARKPEARTMLDIYPDAPWLYVACINLTGLVFFALLCLPWLWRRR